jgi:hypothetical protein
MKLKNRALPLVLGVFGMLIAAGCSTAGSRRLVTHYWLTDPAAGGKADVFPERESGGPLEVAALKQKDDLGLCFSGGGTRSASATLGQLRGLREIKLLERVRYISAVSGGAWAATPYVFLPEGEGAGAPISDQVFLGDYVKPESLTLADLTDAPRESLAHVLSETDIHLRNFLNTLSLKLDESYAASLGEILLEPFGLGDPNRFFTFSPKTRDYVITRNPHLTTDDFYTARAGRPFLICGGTIRRYDWEPWLWDDSEDKRMPVEYTPLYAGLRRSLPDIGRSGHTIGGGYIENFAYDTTSPEYEASMDRYTCAPRWGRRAPFSLSDMIASSGAAPGEYWLPKFLLGLPEFHHWSPVSARAAGKAGEYAHEDGGNSENLGIMPLLARRVRNIMVFVNCPAPCDPANPDVKKRFPADVVKLFGGGRRSSTPAAGQIDNQVFSRRDFLGLTAGLTACLAKGEPLVHCEEYDVLPNPTYGVKGGYKAKICWVVLGPQMRGAGPGAPLPGQMQWFDLIQNEPVKEKLCRPRYEFRKFPYLSTGLNKPTSLIDLTLAEATAMAHFTSWSVVQSAESIKEFFDLDKEDRR